MEKMYRVEIIANQSVEEDITDLLHEEIKDIQYTVLPVVHGKGLRSEKLGTTTWPEQNFLLFTYVNLETAKTIKELVNKIILKFPREGISIFAVEAVEL